MVANNNSIFIDIGEGLSLMVGLPTISTWESDSRPKHPKRGTFGFNFKTSSLEYFDGKYWMQSQMK